MQEEIKHLVFIIFDFFVAGRTAAEGKLVFYIFALIRERCDKRHTVPFIKRMAAAQENILLGLLHKPGRRHIRLPAGAERVMPVNRTHGPFITDIVPPVIYGQYGGSLLPVGQALQKAEGGRQDGSVRNAVGPGKGIHLRQVHMQRHHHIFCDVFLTGIQIPCKFSGPCRKGPYKISIPLLFLLVRRCFQGILDAYLGKCPEEFTYEGKKYTPKSFMQSLGINLDDYVSITSYTHHPFYTGFAVEVQDNWRFPLSYNLPMDEMMQVIDNAVNNGYTIAWGGDVSEDGFTRQGLAYAIDTKKTESLAGSDMAKWLKMTAAKKKNLIDSLGCNVPEITPTQELRQERFDNWELTDDHGMLIYGIAKDQNGKEYYMVKNSWGETGEYKGIWYMTKNFIAANTMDFLVNKNAIPKDIRKKLGI